MDDLLGVQEGHGLDNLSKVVDSQFVALEAESHIIADAIDEGEHVATLAELEHEVQVLLVLEGLEQVDYAGVLEDPEQLHLDLAFVEFEFLGEDGFTFTR